jgi:hypothetical protein
MPTQEELAAARARVNRARLELKRATEALQAISPSDFDRNITQRLMQLQHDERANSAERHNIQQDMLYEWVKHPRLYTKPPQSNVCTCLTCTRSVAHLVHTLYRPVVSDPAPTPTPTSTQE